MENVRVIDNFVGRSVLREAIFGIAAAGNRNGDKIKDTVFDMCVHTLQKSDTSAHLTLRYPYS